MPAMGSWISNRAWPRHAENAAAVCDLRKQVLGDSKQAAEIAVPALHMDIEKRCAAGVGRVGGMDLPAGQPP